jgi:hypothetical protein
MNVKFPNNTSKWQMEFNSAFKGLMLLLYRLYDWQTMNRKDIRDILKSQAANTQLEFEHRTKEVIVQFAEQVGMQTVCC